MKILAVSDRVEALIYSPAIRRNFGDVDLVLACGDLPTYYLEYIVTMLSTRLFYVIGNHANEVQHLYDIPEKWKYPGGCDNLDGRVVRHKGLLLAGLEGSMRYNNNPHFQYTEREMTWKMWKLAPSLLLNKLRHGRYLDILVTHAAPKGIHDRSDVCHTGFEAFLTLMRVFRPRYLIHGHIHAHTPWETTETVYEDTTVLNAYHHRTLEIDERSL
jgi:Icc-related predicted phosphoesterase